jgi:3-oxoacyl-[acyl-carrier protein] reductase
MDLGIRGKIAVVTGAGGAAGRACAVALALEGATVCLVGEDQIVLEQTLTLLSSKGQEGMVLLADLSTEDGCREAVNACVDRYAGVDILVNLITSGAGVSPVLELSEFEVERALAPQLFTYLRMSQLTAPHMMSRRWGRIVNLVSTGGPFATEHGMPGSFAAMAVLNLTKALSDELAADGILVNAVSISSEAAPDHSDVEAIAPVVCFLSSEACSYVFASVLNVEGGVPPAFQGSATRR